MSQRQIKSLARPLIAREKLFLENAKNVPLITAFFAMKNNTQLMWNVKVKKIEQLQEEGSRPMLSALNAANDFLKKKVACIWNAPTEIAIMNGVKCATKNGLNYTMHVE